MKRRAVIKRIEQGANHSIYMLAGKRIPIARHTEIDDLLAEKVFKECEEVLGGRWWR